MKRIISTLLVCVLLVGCVMTLASCGGTIIGTYKSGTTTIEFSLNKVTITDEVEILGTVISKTYEAQYEIKDGDDGKTIVFTYEGDADQHLSLSGEKTFEKGEVDGEKYIKIGLIKYVKD